MLSNVLGKGKTFTGGALLILCGGLSYFHMLPDALTLSITPVESIAAGLGMIGLGSKLQSLISIFKGTPAP